MPRRRRLAVLLVLLLVFVGLPVGLLIWATSVPGESFAGPIPPVTPDRQQVAERLHADVVAIASEPHNLSHVAALARSEAHIAGQLQAAGYGVRTQDVLLPGRNLEVVVEPKEASAPTLVIGAHYDSVMDAPGANDNGSGTAALLELARRLKRHDGQLGRRLRLIFFVNEEPPYFKSNAMGSRVAALALMKSRERVDGMISLETMGYFDDRAGSQHYPFPLGLRYPDTGNFIAFVGDLESRQFLRRSIARFRRHARIPSVGGTAPTFIEGIDWSDHWSFSQEGIPAFMVTDTAPFRYPHYHEPTDSPDKVNYDRLALVVDGLEGLILDLAK
ncbi:MAG TPA: M20/M25/M40 family metallo-hydrolase [Sphingomicrobium sp.]